MDLHSLIRAAIEYIHEAYGEPLSVSDIAGRAYLSATYFAGVFRILTGYTVKDYMSRYRMYRAAVALSETARPVIDIALDCGFQSQQAFTRSFARVYAVAPAHFRRLGIAPKPFPPPDFLEKRGISMELKQAFDGVRYERKNSFLVVGIENDVYYATGYDAIVRSYKRWKDENLINHIPDQVHTGVTYGITHESIEEGMSKYMVGVEVSTIANLPSGLVARRFDACEYAVFDIALDDEGKFWKHFYGVWLGEMGYRQPGMITTKGQYPLPTLPNYEVYDPGFVDGASIIQIYAPILR